MNQERKQLVDKWARWIGFFDTVALMALLYAGERTPSTPTNTLLFTLALVGVIAVFITLLVVQFLARRWFR